MVTSDPHTWTTPPGPWHPQFDPATEVEMLRTFALRLRERDPRWIAELIVTEPGYMHVQLHRGDESSAELRVVLGEGNRGYRYGLFTANQELYFESPDEVVDTLLR